MNGPRRIEAGLRFRCRHSHRWVIWGSEFRLGGRYEDDLDAAEVCPFCRCSSAGSVELVMRGARPL